MSFDYKKEYREFYCPKNKPEIIDIPAMNFVAVRGKGDSNLEDGEYKKAMSILYSVAFTIKMSYKGSHKMVGYFDYVVPPLEGFWWMDGRKGVDYSQKEKFCWTSLIRLPEFVTKEEFDWAVAAASKKKKTDLSKAEFYTYTEGLSVQCMHIGSYDDEPATIDRMKKYAQENGYVIDINENRFHHEIYLSDARRCAKEKLKTVIRYPIKKVSCYV